MKVTVYRPKLADGLGPPQGFRAELHPTEGDWVQSAKSIQPDGIEPHMMLHQIARDFLIRSMYHVTEPRFIGYAVENYGAACLSLGYKLPLSEELATWPNYEKSEVDAASAEDYRWMLDSIAKTFGSRAAEQQAQTLSIEWSFKIKSGSDPGRRR